MEGEARIFWRTGRLALLTGAAISLASCAAVTELEPGAGVPVNPSSPAAAAVAKAAAEPGPWPTFADIPEIPADVRASADWRAAVEEQEAEGLYTERTGGEGTWSLTATEAFALEQRARAGEHDVHAPTDAEIAESEAYARALRKRATPPSPPK